MKVVLVAPLPDGGVDVSTPPEGIQILCLSLYATPKEQIATVRDWIRVALEEKYTCMIFLAQRLYTETLDNLDNRSIRGAQVETVWLETDPPATMGSLVNKEDMSHAFGGDFTYDTWLTHLINEFAY